MVYCLHQENQCLMLLQFLLITDNMNVLENVYKSSEIRLENKMKNSLKIIITITYHLNNLKYTRRNLM